MKLKLLIAIMLMPNLLWAQEGKALFTTHCVVCHGMAGGMDMSARIAPPMIAVKVHYLSAFDKQDEFVQAVVDWVAKPDENKTKMRGAVRRFNLMPALPIATQDVEKIANYIFENELEKPKGFDQHFQQRHGKKFK